MPPRRSHRRTARITINQTFIRSSEPFGACRRGRNKMAPRRKQAPGVYPKRFARSRSRDSSEQQFLDYTSLRAKKKYNRRLCRV
ncbi:Uncharacterized protein APZ42_017299 [Daphnia magna]|uniref:Uncharacterized protein n=1 Tax=Daphnia magna TaxID=35525 RepID=A0A164ZSD2_9CRUS|nr:Uncharacterized protein APZ42_017299 [Daphnia magna]